MLPDTAMSQPMERAEGIARADRERRSSVACPHSTVAASINECWLEERVPARESSVKIFRKEAFKYMGIRDPRCEGWGGALEI